MFVANATPRSHFPITHWPRIRAVQGDNASESSRAIEEICTDYWYPIYAYLRHDGRSAQDAEDLTQIFFQKLITEDILLSAHQEAGKLRTFLLAVLKHLVRNVDRHHSAQKRGGYSRQISIDGMEAGERYALEPMDNRDPEWIFARAWAFELLSGVREKLRASYQISGRAGVFDVLLPFIMWDNEPPSHREIARIIGSSEAGLRILIHRLRAKFRELLKDEVRLTVLNPDEVPAEMVWLKSILAGN